MTRLERVLNLLERYDGLAAAGIKSHNSSLGEVILEDLRKEKDELTKELIEHGCRRGIDIIPQSIFAEMPEMKKETWSGGGFGV